MLVNLHEVIALLANKVDRAIVLNTVKALIESDAQDKADRALRRINAKMDRDMVDIIDYAESTIRLNSDSFQQVVDEVNALDFVSADRRYVSNDGHIPVNVTYTRDRPLIYNGNAYYGERAYTIAKTHNECVNDI